MRYAKGTWKKSLECHLLPGTALFRKEHNHEVPYIRFNELILGYGKGGRAVFILPLCTLRSKVPRKLALFMMQAYDMGCIVGVALDPGDAYDILIDDPKNYKRKKRTYRFIRKELYAKEREQRSENDDPFSSNWSFIASEAAREALADSRRKDSSAEE